MFAVIVGEPVHNVILACVSTHEQNRCEMTSFCPTKLLSLFVSEFELRIRSLNRTVLLEIKRTRIERHDSTTEGIL